MNYFYFSNTISRFLVAIFLYNIFDQYSIALYYTQYYFYNLVVSSNKDSVLSLFLLFILLGILTIFTPCFLSILPLCLSYVASRNNSLNDILLFVSGLLTSFLFIVVFIDVINVYIARDQLPFLSILLMILVSLDLMNIFNLSRFYSLFNSLTVLFNNVFSQKYLTGLILGFTALPCNTSILFIFNFLINHIDNTFSLIIYILAYLLGLVMPLSIIFTFKVYSFGINYFSILWSIFNSVVGFFLFAISLFSLLNLLFN